jgi:hypothetical protein
MLFDRFVGDIYEAALIPERWSGVLDRLAEIADAKTGTGRQGELVSLLRAQS